MLNHRLDDLILKYRSYKIREFLKYLSAFILASTMFLLGFYYKDTLLKEKIKPKVVKKQEFNISKIAPIPVKEVKPKIINVIKIVKVDENKILKKNKYNTLMAVEKSKPTYQSSYDLAQYYFEQKKYKKSSKWAVVSSNRDESKDSAWIIYAKSKVKMKQKGMAKKALKIYLIKYKSQKVKNLLNSI